jgi:hypothetical protein
MLKRLGYPNRFLRYIFEMFYLLPLKAEIYVFSAAKAFDQMYYKSRAILPFSFRVVENKRLHSIELGVKTFFKSFKIPSQRCEGVSLDVQLSGKHITFNYLMFPTFLNELQSVDTIF